MRRVVGRGGPAECVVQHKPAAAPLVEVVGPLAKTPTLSAPSASSAPRPRHAVAAPRIVSPTARAIARDKSTICTRRSRRAAPPSPPSSGPPLRRRRPPPPPPARSRRGDRVGRRHRPSAPHLPRHDVRAGPPPPRAQTHTSTRARAAPLALGGELVGGERRRECDRAMVPHHLLAVDLHQQVARQQPRRQVAAAAAAAAAVAVGGGGGRARRPRRRVRAAWAVGRRRVAR